MFSESAHAPDKSILKLTLHHNFFQSCFHFFRSSSKSSTKSEGKIPASFSQMQSSKLRAFPHSTLLCFWGIFLYHQGEQVVSLYELSFLTPESITGCQTSSLFVGIDKIT